MIKPDYQKIYMDLLKMKFPEKEKDCLPLLNKKNFSQLDVIKLENILFGTTKNDKSLNNGIHRSYDKSTIFKILDYQKKNNLNNSELAKHYGLSRNTVAKWKKYFLV
ncbi:helix-turn-helix domain-containing protein [Chryseobacterium sp. 18068]|jgi:response regulator of citrate/malate metabolism|uniref:helix-turn-helix domain-containing protein n=1 Tax=Chryseobacterium sp. 18068 TaxID=2681414 RepID=UPI001357C28D|nr:helix-turn-helix domain-containing protein [Chryseobacterium sp. 18068]